MARVFILLSVFFLPAAFASEQDEWNPFDPRAEEILDSFDLVYEEETGLSSHITEEPEASLLASPSCFRSTCAVWARIVRSTQTLFLYVNGVSFASWPVSTGKPGFSTPNFDQHPNGRIYDRYSSQKYPGGDYKGLGNMPYAVFIRGGFAIHGTPAANWPNLGKPASHGCIRLHPDNGLQFNRMVRSQGVRNVWITVEP